MITDTKQLTARYTPKPMKVVQNDHQFCIARFSPCGKVLAAGSFVGLVCRWDASSDQLAALPPLTGHGGFVSALAFHADGKRLFTADSWGQLRAWPYAEKNAKPLWSLAQAHDGWIRQMALNADGTRLATCGRDHRLCIWSLADGKKVAAIDAKEDVYSIVFTPDGKSLISGDLKGVIKHWDVATGKLTRTLDARAMFVVDRLNEVGGVRCLRFDPAGATLLAGGATPKNGGFVEATPLLMVFDWATGKAKQSLPLGKANEGFVFDLHCHADGFVMGIVNGPPGQGRLFYLKLGDAQPFFTQNYVNPQCLSLHPSGNRLLVLATNANSSGNGAVLDKDKKYAGNFSPLHVLQFSK